MNPRALASYLRILFKNKLLSTINIAGLSIGMTSCIFIFMYVADELTFDSHHAHLNRIVRITTTFTSEAAVDATAISSGPLGSELKQSYPEIETAARFIAMKKEVAVKKDDQVFNETHIFKADPEVFSIFTFPVLSGDRDTPLQGPNRAVVTRTMAKKYFGADDPLKKRLTIDHHEYEITAVVQDLPANSDLRFNLLLSMDSTDANKDWMDFSYYTYALLKKNTGDATAIAPQLETKLKLLCEEKINKPLRAHDQSVTCALLVQPLSDVHFDNTKQYDNPKGNQRHVYLFSLTASLILLIACLNYVNFSIAQSIERSKEAGIRKVVGAGFPQLVVRYIGESFFITFIALIVSVGTVVLLLPLFNQITGKALAYTNLLSPLMVAVITTIWLLVSVLAGSYPAFYISSIKAIHALKGKISSPSGMAVRKASMVIQFVVSAGLIICTAIIYRQMTFIKNFDVGYQKNNIIIVNTPQDSTDMVRIQSFADMLLSDHSVSDVSITGVDAVPGENVERSTITLMTDGHKDVRMLAFSNTDEAYIPLLGIRMHEGRNFDTARISDHLNSVLVNEALVRMMNWKDPLRQQVEWNGHTRNVIGVIRDIQFGALHNPIEPQVFFHRGEIPGRMFIKLKAGDTHEHLAQIGQAWRTLFPDDPFTFRFLDKSLQAQYLKEEVVTKLFTAFSSVGIAVSCLGLFGLSSLSVYQRKREIGIRKVIGASFVSIGLLFVKEYLVLMVIALVLVCPVTWYVMSEWLSGFLHHVPMGIWVYLIVAVAVIIIALATVFSSIARIANTQPVNLMRD